MNMNKLMLRYVLALAIFLGLSSGASAVLVREIGTSSGMATGSLKLPISSTPQNYWSGLQVLQIDNVASILAYCIDPYQWSPTSNVNYVQRTDFAAFFGSRAADISKLYSLYYTSTLPNPSNQAAANVNAAGFQLALWELVSDNKVLTTGVVQTNGSTNNAVKTAAQNMLNGLAGPASGPAMMFTIYTSSTHQDYLVARVPEPATMLLMLAGLMGIVVASRRRTV